MNKYMATWNEGEVLKAKETLGKLTFLALAYKNNNAQMLENKRKKMTAPTAPLPSQIEETFFSRLTEVKRQEYNKNWTIWDKKLLLTAGAMVGVSLVAPAIGGALLLGAGFVNLASIAVGINNIRRGLMVNANARANYEKEILKLTPEEIKASDTEFLKSYTTAYKDPVLNKQLKELIDKTLDDTSITKILGKKIGELRDKYMPSSQDNKQTPTM